MCKKCPPASLMALIATYLYGVETLFILTLILLTTYTGKKLGSLSYRTNFKYINQGSRTTEYKQFSGVAIEPDSAAS